MVERQNVLQHDDIEFDDKVLDVAACVGLVCTTFRNLVGAVR